MVKSQFQRLHIGLFSRRGMGKMKSVGKDPQRRRLSEALLSLHLRKAEEATLRDPEVRRLVERVRKMYREDQEGIFTAFAATMHEKGPAAARRATPPASKIPQLLLVLSELTQGAPARHVPRPPRPPKSPASREGRLSGRTLQNPKSEPAARAPGDDRERVLMRDIENAKKTLAAIKEEEHLIRARRGKYRVASERLRAERLLRELPGQIAQMEHTLGLLREGVL